MNFHGSGLCVCVWNVQYVGKHAWLSEICVFFSSQWPLLQWLSRRRHGKNLPLFSHLKMCFFFFYVLAIEQSYLYCLTFPCAPGHWEHKLCAFSLTDTEIFPLLAGVIVFGKNQLYIQEIREGDWNKRCLSELQGSAGCSLYVKCLSFKPAWKWTTKMGNTHTQKWISSFCVLPQICRVSPTCQSKGFFNWRTGKHPVLL